MKEFALPIARSIILERSQGREKRGFIAWDDMEKDAFLVSADHISWANLSQKQGGRHKFLHVLIQRSMKINLQTYLPVEVYRKPMYYSTNENIKKRMLYFMGEGYDMFLFFDHRFIEAKDRTKPGDGFHWLGLSPLRSNFDEASQAMTTSFWKAVGGRPASRHVRLLPDQTVAPLDDQAEVLPGQQKKLGQNPSFNLERQGGSG